MQWLNKVVDEIEARFPTGEIIIESGSSPSGTYHLGHVRELVTCDAILMELKRRKPNRLARHIAYVDDLDALRKIPVNVPKTFEEYLGKSLCDIPSPSPDNPNQSYAEFFTQGLVDFCKTLAVDVEFAYSHKYYRDGFFGDSIERALSKASVVKEALESISGRRVGDEWSPIQVNEDGYLKKRPFVGIVHDSDPPMLEYLDKDEKKQKIRYDNGDVKLDWRIDWPARWWKLGVRVEPFGRDHATKGGSYDTGSEIIKKIFGSEPPIPVPYDFVNLAGDNKKMSASKGTGLQATDVVKILPPEIVRFFMLRFPPYKRLYFDPVNVSQLIDEFSELMEKEPNSQLVEICRRGLNPVISRLPFSHLVASYQSALKDPDKTIEIIRRTDPDYEIDQNVEIIKEELKYIGQWLDKWAPEDVRFELADKVDASQFTDAEKAYLAELADEITKAPKDADGEWFHKAIYEVKESHGLTPQQVFKPLYQALIGKEQGPRAGWFLSILPREWLIKRLRLES